MLDQERATNLQTYKLDCLTYESLSNQQREYHR